MGNPNGHQAFYKSFAIGGSLEIEGLLGVNDDIVLRR